jgi:adenosylmethionine-8-amino-7-oxononanoate aminotransferase
LFCGLEVVRDRETKEYFPAEADLGPRLTQSFADQGIILRGGDVMNIMPPLCVTSSEIDEILSVLDRGFGQTSRDLGVE